MRLDFRPIAFASAYILLFTSGNRAGAVTVYNQPALFPGNGFSAWTSTFDPISRGNIYNTYDNFKLTSAAQLTNVSWQGFAFDVNTLGPTSVSLSGFTLSILSDNFGLPGKALYTQQFSGNANQSAVGGVDLFGNGRIETVYNYSTALNGAFTGSANTPYWLSIVGNINVPAYWTWTQGAGGNSNCYQRDFYGNQTGVRSGDRAFTLQGTVVPEPSSAVFFACFVLTGAVLRKRRKR